jgi:hypothetical protein
MLGCIDPKRRYIRHVLSYTDCINIGFLSLKPIRRIMGLNKAHYLLVDDNIANVLINKDNAILISPYKGDPQDTELLKLTHFLLDQHDKSDIASGINKLYYD